MTKMRNDTLAQNFQDALVEQLTSPEGRELLWTEGRTEWPIVDGVETYAEARIATQDKGLVLDLSDGSQVRLTVVAYSPATTDR
jgi:hypothetical protein